MYRMFEKGYLIRQFRDFRFLCLKIIYYRLSSKFNPNTAIFFITKVALFKVTVAFRPYDINFCSCSQLLRWTLFRAKPVCTKLLFRLPLFLEQGSDLLNLACKSFILTALSVIYDITFHDRYCLRKVS